MNYVVRLHQLIGRAVAVDQQVIKVELDYRAIAATQLNISKTPCRGRPAGPKQSLHDCRQAGHHHGAGPVDEPRHEHPHAAQLPERHADLEVLVDLRHPAADDVGQIGIAHTRNEDRADAGEGDSSRSVHDESEVGVDRSPQRNHQFIASTQQVIRRHDRVVVGRVAPSGGAGVGVGITLAACRPR